MTPYDELSELIKKYKLRSLNVKYYDMDLYVDNKQNIYALEKYEDKYRIFISWKKPKTGKELEYDFIKKYINEKLK